MRITDNTRAALEELKRAPGHIADITIRTGLRVEVVRAELRRFCELGVARGVLMATGCIYRLDQGVTLRDVLRADADVAGVCRSGREKIALGRNTGTGAAT